MSNTIQLTRRDSRTEHAAQPGRAEQRLTLNPAVDVIEDPHGVTLWVDLPGAG
jgi:HSP20 family molecular chaperone IbpA